MEINQIHKNVVLTVDPITNVVNIEVTQVISPPVILEVSEVGRKGDQGVKGDKGDKGDTGLDGFSAYEIAINNGTFTGTEVEFAIMQASVANKLDKGGYQGTAQDLSDSIQNIYQPDTVIRYTAPTRVGNTFTFPNGGYDVLLSKQFHTNTSELETTIAAATDGFKRIDLIYYKADDTIAKIEGNESATVAVRPEVPAGGIELCLINVFGATIEVPEVNGAYVQKSERANVVLTGSGVINQLDLVDEKATIVFKGSVTRLNTISYASVPYNGKTIRLFNAQATPVTIGHSVSGYGVDFVFSDAQDYILLPNQTIEFSFDITYAPYAHHMLIGSKGITNWSELQGKPSTFPPSAHTHTISEITDFPTFKTIENQSIIGAGNIDLDKASVGLGNVDNTSDLNKSISTATQTALDDLQLNKEDKANKNIANGYAGLDSSGKINPIQLPALAITDTFVVASQAEQLALVAEVGDVAVRTDLNKSFILRVTGASTLANWQELLSPTSVDQTIIDGSTNAVSSNAVFDGLALKSNIGHTHVASQITDLSKASVGLGNVDNTSDLSKPLSTATINALATKFPTPTGLTTNYLPKWNGSGFGNSNIFDNGTNIGIGTTNLTLSKLQTKGNDGSLIGYFYNNTGTPGQVYGVLIEAGTNTYDFALLVYSSQGSPYFKVNGNGNSLFGTIQDNLVDRVQVAGTISASPATTANQVPTWGQVQAAARPYKVYTALLSQTGTDAPTAIILENTLGASITWTRTGVGQYVGTLSSGAFASNKSFNTINNGQGGAMGFFIVGSSSSTTKTIYTYNASNIQTDSLLTTACVEIRVYN